MSTPFVVVGLLGAGCRGDPAPLDSGLAPVPLDSGPDQRLPFEVVAEATLGEPCGLARNEAIRCGGHTRSFLAHDDAAFADLVWTHLHQEPPEVDLDGRMAVLSFLPWCRQKQRLRTTALYAHDEVLRVDLDHVIPADPGQATCCPYSLVTLAAADVRDVEVQVQVVHE